MSKKSNGLLPRELIEKRIHLFRGEKVMLDRDLAQLYGVSTKTLNQAVKRNLERFPKDFMFQLNLNETKRSRSQIVTLKRGQNIKYLPYAFTENGVAMLSSVLNSDHAIQVNIQIMRTFTRVRQLLTSEKEILKQLAEHGQRLSSHDGQLVRIFDVIQCLLALPVTLKRKGRRIGFVPPEKVPDESALGKG
jgi:hypothetical protein